MTTVELSRPEVDRMLAEAAERYGYSYEEVASMASSGTLEEPELRDLWLIWGASPLNARQ